MVKQNDPFKAKKYKKVIKIPSSMKVIKTQLTPLKIELKNKKLFGRKKVKSIRLPKGSVPMEIFYRPVLNEIHMSYIKKSDLTKKGLSRL